MHPRQPHPPLIEVPDTPPKSELLSMARASLIARPGLPLAPKSVREVAWALGLAAVRHRRRPVAAEPKDAA